MSTVTVDRRSRAGRREWAGLVVLTLPLLVVSFDVSILYLAAPELSADLGASATEQLWILDVYGFLIGGFLLTMGTLGDRIGRRRLLLIGGAAFAAASVLAAFAPSGGALIAARALLGVAGATLMPSTLGLIRTMFPDARQRSFAISVWVTAFSGGAALGPVLGGLMLQWFWWGSVFLLGVPFMVALLALGPLLLPETRVAGVGGVDLTSVALSLGAMLPLVWAVKETAAYGPGLAASVALALGAAVGVAFVRRQQRLADPMLDLALFRERAFVAAVALLFLGLLALNGLFFLLPQFLQYVADLDPLAAGLAMLPLAAVTMMGSLATPRAVARWGRTVVLAGAVTVGALGATGIVLTASEAGPATVVALTAVAVLGIAPVGILATDLVVGSAPPERAGSAAAVSETGGELGVALGVALIGSVVTGVYGARLATTLPAGVPPQVEAAAGEGVAAAVSAAQGLDPTRGGALREAAVAAFADAFAVAGAVSAGIASLIVVLVLTALRDGSRRRGRAS